MAQLAVEPAALYLSGPGTQIAGVVTTDDGAKLNNRVEHQLGLHTASEANWGKFDNRGYSTEVIYSSSDQDYSGLSPLGSTMGFMKEDGLGLSY